MSDVESFLSSGIITTVDVVLFTLKNDRLHVVLQMRSREPYLNQLALPGGYVRVADDIDTTSAASRVLLQKTGLISPYLEQLYTFSGAVRDPRGWSVSIAYYALVSLSTLRVEGNATYTVMDVAEIPPLSFDHNHIINVALMRLRNKSTYSSLPCYLLPELFTLTELQHAYESVMSMPLDKSVFRRKLAELDFLEQAENATRTGNHRPAQLYRIKPDRRLTIFDRTV